MGFPFSETWIRACCDHRPTCMQQLNPLRLVLTQESTGRYKVTLSGIDLFLMIFFELEAKIKQEASFKRDVVSVLTTKNSS